MDFKKWLFEKRDIDGLIIAFIVSNAISGFIRDFTDGVVNPILIGILPSNSETDTQTLNINNTLIIKFRLQLLLSGILKVLINLLIAYVIVMYVFNFFGVNK